jgi:putative two-component system response regulator
MTSDALKTAKILLVDDEPMNVDLLQLILRDAGYPHLTSVTDSRRAVAIFADADPDLVLLDLHMPHQDGYEVLQMLRYLVPADAFLPIIVITADVTVDARRRALTAGATDFISKPYDTIEMMLRVENMLRMRFLHRELQSEKASLEQRVKERTRSLKRVIAELRCTAMPLFSAHI